MLTPPSFPYAFMTITFSYLDRKEIHAMKMTVLPKILYYFCTLPVRVSPFFLFPPTKLDTFVHLGPETPLQSPQVHRPQGGLGVLNLSRYYVAAQISPLSMLYAVSDVPLWVLLELSNCAPISLQTLLWLLHK